MHDINGDFAINTVQGQDSAIEAENIVVVIYNKLKKILTSEQSMEVVLYETPRNFVTYSENL